MTLNLKYVSSRQYIVGYIFLDPFCQLPNMITDTVGIMSTICFLLIYVISSYFIPYPSITAFHCVKVDIF